MKRIAELMMHVAGLAIAVSCMRAKALRLYRRHYLIALLTATTSEQAADIAMTKTKAKSQQIIDEHAVTKKLSAQDREEIWGDILDVLLEWQMLLTNIPVDESRLRPDAYAGFDPDANWDVDAADSFLLPAARPIVAELVGPPKDTEGKP